MLSRVKLTAFDFALYATVVLAWGFAWIAIHFQVGVVAPDVSIFWRFAFAGVIMLAIAAIRGDQLRYGLRDHVMFAVLGLLLFSLNFLLFYHAAETLPSGLLSIVFSLASFINVWLGALFLGSPIDRRVVIGGLLGTAGMAAMFYPQFSGAALPPQRADRAGFESRGHARVLLRQHRVSAHLQRRGISGLRGDRLRHALWQRRGSQSMR